MRRILVTLMAASLLLVACQGGEGLSKAASVPQSEVGHQSPVAEGNAPGDATCLSKCRAKADEKYAKCMKGNSAEKCSETQVENILQCADSCTIR